MPPVSEAQRKAMYAASEGNSTLGIPKKVAREFVAADPGGKLPEKKTAKLYDHPRSGKKMTDAPTVTMIKVDSSNIDAVGHDPKSNELHVHFKNGSKYIHSDVPRAFYQNMLQSPSKGKYHAERIKGVFPHRKL